MQKAPVNAKNNQHEFLIQQYEIRNLENQNRDGGTCQNQYQNDS